MNFTLYDQDITPVLFSILDYSTFESKEALNSYQVNPIHKEVASYIKSVATNAVVVDYEI